MAKIKLLLIQTILVLIFQFSLQALADQECNSNPCPHNATCINGISAYSCKCPQGYYGSHCSLGPVKNGDVRLVDGNATSGNVQVYYDGRWGGICGHDWNFYSARVICRQLGFDLAIKTYCCSNFTTDEIIPIWLKDIRCRGNECSLSRCPNLNWGSVGNCDSYANNYAGVECAVVACSSFPCVNGLCISSINSGYTCQCNAGWTGQQCDVREGPPPDETKLPCYRCDTNALCHIHHQESYNCTCKPGYIGNGSFCKERRLYPYGTQYGDISISHVDDEPYRLHFLSPIFFTNSFYKKAYVSMNGFLSFNRAFMGRPKRPFTARRYPPLIAPLFADADASHSDQARIYISQYSSLNPSPLGIAILQNATHDVHSFQNYMSHNPNVSNHYGLFNKTVTDFNATHVTIITWHKVIPYPSIITSKCNISNTFQLVLVSNGMHLFALFIYDDKGVNWWQRYGHIRPRAGFTNQAACCTKYAYELPNSGSKTLLKIDSMTGNDGHEGKWVFRLDDPASDRINYADRCQNWFSNDTDALTYVEALRNRQCPCYSAQAICDTQFRFNMTTFCAISTFPTRATNGQLVYQQCCYSSSSDSFGSLITTYPLGKSFLFKDSTLQETTLQAYLDCCVRSKLCYLFYIKRSINRCFGYRPPRSAWCWGDPHIKTLDGKEYTFNGLGEYVLLQSIDRSFILQARTRKAAFNSSLSAAATVLSAFAVTAKDADIIQFTLNATLNGITILVARTTSFSLHNMMENEIREFNNVDIVRTSNKSVVAIFSSGISVEVTLLTQMLTIAFNGEDQIKGMTSGLLGTWNGNINDDFQRPDGTLLDINSDESTIFHQFGQLWMIDTSDSLFTYPKGESADDYRDVNFIPMFGDNIKALFGNNIQFYNQSMARCKDNTGCLYDAALTLNLDAAIDSRDTVQVYEERSHRLQHFPPELSGLTTYNVTYGKLFTTRLNVTDQNGDQCITVKIIDAPDQSYFDSQSYTFTWNVSQYRNISFKFVAIDSEGATSELIPTIIMCYCPNNGTCDYAAEMTSLDNIDMVECICDPAWTGDNCSQDYNACSDQPCFNNMTCVDHIAPRAGYECGDCPLGYVGDGLKCYDLNECENGTHNCAQICINEEGSYLCQCRSGYKLANDSRACIDIDECKIGSNNCSDLATCVNRPGSYECICNSGYKGDGVDCSDANECKLNNGYCNHLCINTEGSYHCACYPGYEIGDHYHSCVDIDECKRPLSHQQCDQQCVNTQGSYHCQCHPGFQLDSDGFTCRPLHPCSYQNNCTQICSVQNGLAVCSCQLGFKLSTDGRTCLDIDECLTNHSCHVDATCRNTVGSYRCQCNVGYQGDGVRCHDIDECAADQNICSPHAYCNNNNGSYDCECKDGYQGDGLLCHDMDECQLKKDKCSIYAICSNTEGSYDCKCKSGYTGDGFTCLDVNECHSNQFQCAENSLCINNNGSYQCQCQAGFTGDGKLSCHDINECLSNQNHCHTYADCQNIPGSYNCSCRSGYYGNGRNCTKMTACSRHHCGRKATCQLTNDNNYYCNCRLVYYINTSHPLAIDQYQSDSHCQPGKVFLSSFKILDQYKPELANPASAEYQALSAQVTKILNRQFNSLHITKGIFKRLSIIGFTSGSIVVNHTIVLDSSANIKLDQLIKSMTNSHLTIDGRPIHDVTVGDYNECANSNDNLCLSNQTCVNLLGTYSCQCPPGYTGLNCVDDINECMTDYNPCGINATCTNTIGSYSCQCPIGYQGDASKACYLACNNDYCLNGGTCTYHMDLRKCACTEGFSGDRCAENSDKGKSALKTILGASIGSVGMVIVVIIVIVYYVNHRVNNQSELKRSEYQPI